MLIYATASFWAGLAERAIKTAAQAALAFLATAGAGVLDWDFKALASVTAAAVILSILTSLATPTQATAANLTIHTPSTPDEPQPLDDTPPTSRYRHAAP